MFYIKVRKLLVVFVASVFLLQSAGVFVILEIQKWYSKFVQIIEILQTEESETLTMSAQEFQQCKINRWEMFYNDEMYDIKSVKKSGNQCVVKAVPDVKEKQVVKKIGDIFSKQEKNRRKQSNYPIFAFHSVCFLPLGHHTFFVYPKLVNKSYPLAVPIKLLFISIPSPPPKF